MFVEWWIPAAPINVERHAAGFPVSPHLDFMASQNCAHRKKMPGMRKEAADFPGSQLF
jgi:hypothetical protein